MWGPPGTGFGTRALRAVWPGRRPGPRIAASAPCPRGIGAPRGRREGGKGGLGKPTGRPSKNKGASKEAFGAATCTWRSVLGAAPCQARQSASRYNRDPWAARPVSSNAGAVLPSLTRDGYASRPTTYPGIWGANHATAATQVSHLTFLRPDEPKPAREWSRLASG